MALDKKLVGVVSEIGGDPTRVVEQRKGAAGIGCAAVTHGEHTGNEAEAIGLDGATHIAEYDRNAGAGTLGMGCKVGEQRELRGYIRDGRRWRLRGLEERLLAGRLDLVAGNRVEAGERRAR